MKKQYIYKNISYGFSVKARKWLFTNGNGYSLFVSVSGKEVAEKIAHVISGGLIRSKSNTIDNLARANINKLTLPIEQKC